MEKNNVFCWNINKIYFTPNLNENKEKKFEDKPKEEIIEKNIFILQENYFDNKIKTKKEKYNIDLGACIINANNQILCFNKNTIINQANAYFKVDQLIIEDSNRNEIKAENIFSRLNGPRFRVTNVFIIVFDDKN